MNKKKVISLLIAGTVATGIIGGTLAWFTSQDNVTNTFSTGSYNDDSDSGLDIYENFKKAENVTPGTETTKVVQVKNEASYSQYIRVKLTPQWTTDAAKEADPDADLLILNFGNNLGDAEGKWIDGGDGYYYYLGVVDSNKFTNKLLDSVTLSPQAGNEFLKAAYTVRVDAESIQSSNNAIDSWKTSTNSSVIDKVKTFTQPGGNDTPVSGATKTAPNEVR